MRIGLAATASRVLRVTIRDQDERLIEVTVNERPLTTIRDGTAGGQWLTMEFPLPDDTPDTFVVAFMNHARSAAISQLEVAYKGR